MSKLYILYGSATGNAEHIAKELAARSEDAICAPLDSFRRYQEDWKAAPSSNERHGLIVVCSTTGNGDAPENAGRLVRFLKRKTTPPDSLQNVAFCVLALGDTNYDQFCASGKLIDKRLSELGGQRIQKVACADEGTGLEDVVEPWKATVLERVQQAMRGEFVVAAQEAEEVAPVKKEQEAKASSPVKTASADDVPLKSTSPLFVMYASATGNAEHIAKDLASSYKGDYFPSVVCCELDQWKKKDAMTHWEKAPPAGRRHGILVVASTTGNGDIPENGNRFFRFIKRKTTPQDTFGHTVHSVLALGDTNYDQFCAAGLNVDKRMCDLGSTRMRRVACADEGTGLEEVVEGWKATILDDMERACRGENVVAQAVGVNGAEAPKAAAEEAPTKEIKSEDATPPPVPVPTPAPAVPEPPAPVSATPPPAITARSPGVASLCAMLGLCDNDPLPSVAHSDLPPLGTSLSSCALLAAEEPEAASTLDLAEMDRMTMSSASSMVFSHAKPFQSSIVAARYLTNTSKDAAVAAAAVLRSNPDKIDGAMEIYEQQFPLTENSTNGKRVIEMRLSLPDDFTLDYQPGDSLGISVPNPPAAVSFILNMLKRHHGVEGSQRLSIDDNSPTTVEEVMRHNLDLSSPILKNKRVLRSLSQFATDEHDIAALRLLASKCHSDVFEKFVAESRLTVVDLLQAFESCQTISVTGLIGMLPSIPPRYYSVTSSPLKDKLSLTIAFSVVDYMAPGERRIGGVATRYFEALASDFLSGAGSSAPATLGIFPKPSSDFHLPSSLQTPLILVGPGTGVAPFLGFIQHRQAQLASQKTAAKQVVEGTWRGDYEMEEDELPTDAPKKNGVSVGDIEVYFGCRHAKHDYLYEAELQSFVESGLVTKLHTAFSRDGNKQYVQDLMTESIVNAILDRQASVYVCGDGNAMAKDVQTKIVDLLKGRVEDADKYLEDMKAQHRFVMDIWS